jgi:hypothetical protein
MPSALQRWAFEFCGSALLVRYVGATSDARRFHVCAAFWLRCGPHVQKYAPVRYSPKPCGNANWASGCWVDSKGSAMDARYVEQRATPADFTFARRFGCVAVLTYRSTLRSATRPSLAETRTRRAAASETLDGLRCSYGMSEQRATPADFTFARRFGCVAVLTYRSTLRSATHQSLAETRTRRAAASETLNGLRCSYSMSSIERRPP